VATRRCACGRELEEVGPRVRCPSCGSSCGTWAVESDGERVAVASESEVLPGRRMRETLRDSALVAWSDLST